MADFATSMGQHQNLSEAKQKQIGQSGGTTMDEEHTNYLATIIGMLDRKEISTLDPQSILKQENYDKLGEEERAKVDLALVNITDLLHRIEVSYRDRTTPNASPELQSMIEHLWQMKNRIEDQYGDVYKL